MSLVNKYQSIMKQIDNLLDLKQNHDEAKELREFSDYIEEFVQRVSEQLENIQLFRAQCKINKPPAISVQTQLVNSLSQRFAAKPNRQSIVKGKDWVRLCEEVDSFVKQVGNSLHASWREFCNDAFSGPAPDELKHTIALTDHNENLLLEYKAFYRDFLESSKQFPKRSDDFAKIRDLGLNLKTILTQLDTNVPNEVKYFFDNINLYGGASLDIMTKTVIDWLMQHDSINRYRVTRKSQNS